MVHLTNQLLTKARAYNVYMDNYFASILLFRYLWSKGIRVCRTIRTNSVQFPKLLKTKDKLDWNILSGVVTSSILAALWVNNLAVTMLTTIHSLKGLNWSI